NNATIDHLRGRNRDTLSLDCSPHAGTAEATEATTLHISDGSESPPEEGAKRELGGYIEKAIGKPRPEYPNCIRLRHVEGRPSVGIAEILDLPLGTVKTYIHRARNELRVLLAELHDD